MNASIKKSQETYKSVLSTTLLGGKRHSGVHAFQAFLFLRFLSPSEPFCFQLVFPVGGSQAVIPALGILPMLKNLIHHDND
jgi:hypothetical protein